MRSSVDAAAFYKAMTALMDIPAKSPVKVLQEIKVEFTADHCTLSATDFGTWLSVTIPASGDNFAFVFWNSAGVQKVCRYFTGQLELELSGQRKSQIITMCCGDKGGKFPVYEAEECPTWPEFEAKQSYTANAANILKCVKQVKYAVDLRSTRPEYQGVLFQNKHIWAVEGHRAACCDDGGLSVLFAAQQHAMAHSADLVHGLDRTMFGIGQSLDYIAHRVHMIAHRRFDLEFAAVLLMHQIGAFDADALDQTLGDYLLVFHVDQLILERRRAGVYNQYLHYISSFSAL